MGVIRTQELVPEVYVNGSRDFEMLCNLYDVALNISKYYTDGMQDITNTSNINADLLQLLASKIGFESKKKFNDEELRYILEALPILIRGKGSLGAVKKLLDMCLKLYHINAKYDISVTKQSTVFGKINLDAHTIVVGIESIVDSTELIKEVGKYILPTGFSLYIYFYQGLSLTDYIQDDDVIEVLFSSDNINSQIRAHNVNEPVHDIPFDFSLDTLQNLPKYELYGDEDTLYDGLIGAVGNSWICGVNDTVKFDEDNFLGVYNKDVSQILGQDGKVCIAVDTLNDYKTYASFICTGGKWKHLDFKGTYKNLGSINPKISTDSVDVYALDNREVLVRTSEESDWQVYDYIGKYDTAKDVPITKIGSVVFIINSDRYYLICSDGTLKELINRGTYFTRNELNHFAPTFMGFQVYDNENNIKGIFATQEEAEEWIKSHPSVGDTEYFILQSDNVSIMHGATYWVYNSTSESTTPDWHNYTGPMYMLRSSLVENQVVKE